ncbi:hypothetical protein NBRC116590_14510 [Pelagimonas sp. KU-00592-HH]|uniref:hypothetical protein n=1 Tax=Pelagimonas sp. KU-00592-HH TaxID=3127651 RepID=UPI00310A7304
MPWHINKKSKDLVDAHYALPTRDELIKNASATIGELDQSIAFMHEIRANALSQVRGEGMEDAKQIALEIDALENAQRMLQGFVDRTSQS